MEMFTVLEGGSKYFAQQYFVIRELERRKDFLGDSRNLADIWNILDINDY